MKILIVGTRSFDNYDAFFEYVNVVINQETRKATSPITILSDERKGVGKFAKRYARENNISYVQYSIRTDFATPLDRDNALVRDADISVFIDDKQDWHTRYMLDAMKALGKPTRRLLVKRRKKKEEEPK